MALTHKPKAGATLTGTEWEAADAHEGVLADGNIPASIARDTEVTNAVAAEATARDAAITTHSGAADPHGDRAAATSALGTHEADTTSVHGIANTANVVLTNDARLSDARTPTAHKTSHEDGGADEISLTGLAGAPAALTNHEGAADPHPGYLTPAEGNAAYDASGAAASAQSAAIAASWPTLATGLTAAAKTVLDDTTVGAMVDTLGGASATGTGGLVRATSPVLVTPALGTPASGVATNLTGTAAGLTAGNVTTNANLTGDVTSSGNATTIGSGKVTEAMQVLADNTTQDVSTSKHGYAPKGDGTTTKFLNANGAYSTPAGGSGAKVFLEAHAASASATLDFTTFISSTYDTYEIEGVDIIAATNAATLLMRMGTGGGPTFDSGSNYAYNRVYYQIGGGFNSFAGSVNGASQSSITVMVLVSSTAPTQFTMRLKSPQNSSYPKFVEHEGSQKASDGNNYRNVMASGVYTATTALTAVQFLMSSGNIASGTIRVYGLAKS